MRSPTTSAQAYSWHRKALAGENPPVHEGAPQCGWFKRRLVKGGPFVPARIFMQSEMDPETGELLSDEKLVAEVNGKRADPTECWTWICGQPISRAEYLDMTAASFADQQEPKYHF